MENPTGESTDGVLRLDFDRKVMAANSMAAVLAGACIGEDVSRHRAELLFEGPSSLPMPDCWRQSVFGRLAGYEDVRRRTPA
jgi:hypothetical protein